MDCIDDHLTGCRG